MNSMATYQNDVHSSRMLSAGAATSVPQNGTSQAPVRSHSSSMLTGLIPMTTAQPKLATNVSFVPSNCVLVNGAGVVQPNVVITTQYQNPVYQQPYTTVMQRVYSSPVLMTSQQQQTTGFLVTSHPNSHPSTVYEEDGLVEQSSASGSLSLNIPMHEEPVFQAPKQESATVEAVPEPATTSVVIDEEPEPEGEIDIQIRNVVCNFTLPLHIDLHRVALNSGNVTFDRGRGVLLKQKRDPSCFVKVYSSGKIYIVGCRSESECKRAARGVARMVQKRMGKASDLVRIRNYKICNVLATCKMPFGIKIEELAKKHPDKTQYEPELKVGLDWKCHDPKATLRIHTTGSITVLGAVSEGDVMRAIEIIYPIVREFRCPFRSRETGTSRKRKHIVKRSSSEEDLLLDVKRPHVPPKQLQPSGFEPRNGASSGVIGNKVYFSDEDDEFDDGD